ncbi:MAG: class I SAM-dependent methyltransferase [Desulfuromonadales bacterium]
MLEHYSSFAEPYGFPACGKTADSVSYRYQLVNGDSFIYRYRGCTFEFMRPKPMVEMNERQMESVIDAELLHINIFQSLHEKLIFIPEVSHVKKLLGRNNFSKLDVCCGTGWISRIWVNDGARVTGLVPYSARSAVVRERNIRVLSCYTEELDVEDNFDLIVIRHVLEHFKVLKAILRSFMSRLNPNWLLLVVVPNIDCVIRKIFDANWTWMPPWHYNFFNPSSLKKLVARCGFPVLKSWQTPSPLWYPGSSDRKFSRLVAMLKITPLTKLLFAPLVGLGYLSGCSANLTHIAHPIAEQKQQ